MAVHDRWRVVRYYYAVGLTIFSITMCYSGATLPLPQWVLLSS